MCFQCVVYADESMERGGDFVRIFLTPKSCRSDVIECSVGDFPGGARIAQQCAHGGGGLSIYPRVPNATECGDRTRVGCWLMTVRRRERRPKISGLDIFKELQL